VKLSDVELPRATLERARAGDPLALEAFYRAFARPAYGLVRRIVRGAAADDVLQDAFVDAFRGLAGYDGRAPVGAWFRSVVVRRCFMHLRSPWQRSREWLGDRLDSLHEGEAQDGRSGAAYAASADAGPGTALDLERALARLPALTRLVVWLHDVEGYTHEEIAAATGRTASFSKSQLARGHARLRAWLEPEAAEPADVEVKVSCTRANP
jgi:RNA polymerase sigma-70 factor (ECF subfamily)